VDLSGSWTVFLFFNHAAGILSDAPRFCSANSQKLFRTVVDRSIAIAAEIPIERGSDPCKSGFLFRGPGRWSLRLARPGFAGSGELEFADLADADRPGKRRCHRGRASVLRFRICAFTVFRSRFGLRRIVEPVTSGGDGIRFLSNWSAAQGDGLTNTISYQVDSVDESPSISTISLLSDGTAPSVAPGAFAATSLTARDSGGAPIGRTLGTYNDGVTTPVGTTNPDNNTDFLRFSPNNSLGITDSIILASGVPGQGGDVSLTSLENTFDPVALPSPDGTLVLPFVAGFGMLRRRPRKHGNLAPAPKVIENGSAAVYKCSQPIA